jgi:hypothetical protein
MCQDALSEWLSCEATTDLWECGTDGHAVLLLDCFDKMNAYLSCLTG